MIYAKIEVILPRHHRVQAIDRASALGVYVAMMCYSREFELDGFVPAVALRGFPNHSRSDVSELVRVGLIASDELDGVKGYRVIKYAEKNETKKQIDERRSEAAERMRVVRENRKRTSHEQKEKFAERSQNVPGSGSGSDLLSLSEGGAGGNQAPPDPITDVKPTEQAYQNAYETGIIEGLGQGATYGMPENQRGALHQIILAHSQKRRGDKLLAWIKAAAADFAEAMRKRPKDIDFYSGLGPKGCLKWLNEEAAKVLAKAAP